MSQPSDPLVNFHAHKQPSVVIHIDSETVAPALPRTASDVAEHYKRIELQKVFQYLSKRTLYIDSSRFVTALHRTDVQLNSDGPTSLAVAEEFLRMAGEGSVKVDFAAFMKSQAEIPVLKRFTEKLRPLVDELTEEAKRASDPLMLMFNALKGASEREWIDPVAFASVLREIEFTKEEGKNVISVKECDALLRSIAKSGQVYFTDFQTAVTVTRDPVVRRLIACLASQSQQERKSQLLPVDQKALEQPVSEEDSKTLPIQEVTLAGDMETTLSSEDTKTQPIQEVKTVIDTENPLLPVSPVLSNVSSVPGEQLMQGVESDLSQPTAPTAGAAEQQPSRKEHIDISDEQAGLVSNREKEMVPSGWRYWCCCRKKIKSR